MFSHASSAYIDISRSYSNIVINSSVACSSVVDVFSREIAALQSKWKTRPSTRPHAHLVANSMQDQYLCSIWLVSPLLKAMGA